GPVVASGMTFGPGCAGAILEARYQHLVGPILGLEAFLTGRTGILYTSLTRLKVRWGTDSVPVLESRAIGPGPQCVDGLRAARLADGGTTWRVTGWERSMLMK